MEQNYSSGEDQANQITKKLMEFSSFTKLSHQYVWYQDMWMEAGQNEIKSSCTLTLFSVIPKNNKSYFCKEVLSALKKMFCFIVYRHM